MEGRGEGRRVKIATRTEFTYGGESAANQALEYVISAAQHCVHIAIGFDASGSRAACLADLEQARLWAERCDLEALTVMARWGVHERLVMQCLTLNSWFRAHHGDKLSRGIIAIFHTLSAIVIGIYTEQDHWLRLYSAGYGSPVELRRHLGPDVVSPAPLTRERLVAMIAEMRAGAVALPLP